MIQEIGQGMWEKIIELMTKLGINSREAVILIIIILSIDGFLLHKKNKAKQQFILKQEEGKHDEDERYVTYYKQKQYIQTLRGVMWAIVILSFILYHKPNIFAGLAIAL